ncbi:unnamed protein product [Acanthoscelides obtectus]|uniref:Uncharacterized protein n=1 Tax=Acanthoscelides obtectus TaxID=200917 RepID=A0A9P0JV60_ACAOB|nr:unnamed protein product [Acanthoscelides obtectus]CAK1647965.1 hypothetical protein AOBTE_LOCUS15478 [Acanthoscelides obtectus]
MLKSGAPTVLCALELIDRAVAVDAEIRIVPKGEDDYRKIVRLFKEENVPYHTFPLSSEHNIHNLEGSLPSRKSKRSSNRRDIVPTT